MLSIKKYWQSCSYAVLGPEDLVIDINADPDASPKRVAPEAAVVLEDLFDSLGGDDKKKKRASNSDFPAKSQYVSDYPGVGYHYKKYRGYTTSQASYVTFFSPKTVPHKTSYALS